MSWRKLVPITLILTAFAIGGITLATPGNLDAQVQLNCGENNGNLCRKKCNETCHGGTSTECCDESYWYYPKADE